MKKTLAAILHLSMVVGLCMCVAAIAGCPDNTPPVDNDPPSNADRVFWAVDLDQQDAMNDPASAPWGVVLSNTGQSTADVKIEINEADPGAPLQLATVTEVTVPPDSAQAVILPTRELDGGPAPNTYSAPGTCLSSRAFRITSSTPITVYQFNNFENSFSSDASLLLPSQALGTNYRVLGWMAGHPIPTSFPEIGTIVDRSYVTVVGTQPSTVVTVVPGWRIRGNAPIDATPAGGTIVVTLNEFDVLNLETDDATYTDEPTEMADLSGTVVTATAPVAVFSGTESAQVPGWVSVPTYPGWDDDTAGLDHLEEQLVPVESVGTKYVVARSPVRSTTTYREPDIIRFVGAAEIASVSTTLPTPFDSFTLQPGEVRTTWTQDNFVATSDKPFMVGQLLISQGYVEGPKTGDPSLTIFPSIDQYRSKYVVLTPGSWTQNWLVVVAQVGASITLDGATMTGYTTETAGTIGSTNYETRRCPLTEGVHRLSSDIPFGVVLYGYGSAGSYALVGGADL